MNSFTVEKDARTNYSNSNSQDHEFRLVTCQPVLLQDQLEPGLVKLGLVGIVHLRRLCGCPQRGDGGRNKIKKKEKKWGKEEKQKKKVN